MITPHTCPSSYSIVRTSLVVVFLSLLWIPLRGGQFLGEVTNPVRDGVAHVAQQVDQGTKHAEDQVKNGVQHVIDQGHNAAAQAGGQIDQALKHNEQEAVKLIPTVANAISNANEQVKKAVTDVKNNGEKAGGDISLNLRLSYRDTLDAAQAVGDYCRNEAKSIANAPAKIQKDLEEKTVVDALWTMATYQLTQEDKNMAIAAQQNKIINVVGQTAATAYGGPEGAAAYAAWYTYHETGNVDLSIRAGVISGATAYAMKHLPVAQGAAPIPATVQKAIEAGAVGATAVGVAGGNNSAMRDSFVQAGMVVVVQDLYAGYMKHPMDLKGAKKPAYVFCAEGDPDPDAFPKDAYVYGTDGKPEIGDDGKPLIDVSKLDPSRNHVGLQAFKGETGTLYENSQFMNTVGQIPGMNAMAFFHDQWCFSWKIPPAGLIPTIPPAIVLTYFGSGSTVLVDLQHTVVTKKKDPWLGRSG